MNTFATILKQNSTEAVIVEGFLKVRDAAERLGVNRKTIVRWIEEGYLPGSVRLNPMVPRSPYRIPVAAVEAIEKQRKPSTSADSMDTEG